jgi:hypothetical protein
MIEAIAKLRFCFLMLFVSTLHAKVLIITHAYNRPEFIDYQVKCFQKFLQDDYEFVVFNDAPPGMTHDAIVEACSKHTIRCLPIPQEIHHHPQESEWWQNNTAAEGTKRHVDGIQYSLDLMGYEHDGIVAFFDSDLFLIKPFSIEKALAKHDIVSMMRFPMIGTNDVLHLWPGLCFLAMHRLPEKHTLDFKCGALNNRILDTGGYTYFYLRDHPEVSLLSLGIFPIGDVAVNIELYHEDHFVHYGEGRNQNEAKSRALLALINQALED